MEKVALERQKRLRGLSAPSNNNDDGSNDFALKSMTEIIDQQETTTKIGEEIGEEIEQIPIESLIPNKNEDLKKRYEELYAPLREKTDDALHTILREKTKE